MSQTWLSCFIFLLTIFFFFLSPGPSLADLVINEFLPDPDGADGGREFVEFLNTGPSPVNLQGLAFQFANGSVGPQWATRWTCQEDIWLTEGERFLLADRNWQGQQQAQAEVWLGLQNGPDAIRLLFEGEVLDLVGYGPLTDEDMMEGQAVALPVGLSLMRKPDGRDTGDNHLDFFPGEPTPGQVNYLNHQIEVFSVVMEPAALAEAGGIVQLDVVLENTGMQDLLPAPMTVWLRTDSGELLPALETIFAGCVSSGRCQLLLALTVPVRGRLNILLQLPVGDSEDALQVSLGKIQVGCGAVFLSEVLGSPSMHQGEWIEIQAGSQALHLGNFKIRDEEGGWRSLPQMDLEPGQFLLVAQDSSALIAWHFDNLGQGLMLDCPADQMGRVLRQMPGAWPSLNNNPPDSRTFSDRVYLADEEGVVDQFTIPDPRQAGDLEGKSWERRSHDPQSFLWNQWRPSLAAAGSTPGCFNSIAPQTGQPTSDLEILPPILDSQMGQNIVHIRFLLALEEMGWHVEIYDLWGGLVRDLGGAETGPGPGDLIWDGKDDHGHRVQNGGYVVLLHKRHQGGVFHPASKELVVVR